MAYLPQFFALTSHDNAKQQLFLWRFWKTVSSVLSITGDSTVYNTGLYRSGLRISVWPTTWTQLELRKETEELLQKRLLKSCPSCRYYAALLRASLREAFGCKLASVMRLSNIIIFLGALCEFAVLTISKGVPSDMKETSDFFLFIGDSQLLYGDAMTYGFANILRRELRAINRGTSFEVH